MVVYQFKLLLWSKLYRIGNKGTKKRIKEHVPKSIEIFWYSEKKKDLPVKVLNASKCSSIVEHLENNPTCDSG